MDAIIKAIGKTPSLATLPLRVEEGYLPALLTQSGGAMRALGAAMLRRETDRPIFVLCTDDSNAGTLAADLEAMLGESVVQLTGRDLALRDIEVVSRQEEQRRLRALDALYAGALVAVCTVSGLLQRTLPPDILENAAFTLRLGEGEGPEALEPRLLACGYRRSDMVEGPGQFSRSAPCAPNSGATRSTPWAFSTPIRSAARRISNPSVCCPRANRSSIPAAPGA